MRKSKHLLVVLISVLLVCLAFAACGSEGSAPKAEYSLDKTEIALVVGETHQIEVKSTQNGKFAATYESDKPDCASVGENGLVTAVSPGTAVVKVTVDGTELSLKVTVEHKYELNKTSETLEEGDTVQLAVITTPDKSVTPQWSVSPAEVASVSETGLVTALAKGTATVTATADGKTLTCALTVTEKSVRYTLNHASASIEKGDSLQLALVCEPEQEGVEVAWESSNTAAVTVDQSGLVTAVAVGAANVNAKVGGKVVATCKVTAFEYAYSFAKSLTVDYGDDTKTLAVTVTPDKPIDIKYEADGDDVITVAANGAITTVGVGTATVTVKDGETELGTCTVKVRAVVSSVEEFVRLHVGGTHAIAITSAPSADAFEVAYEVVKGTNVVEIGGDKTLTALANGEARIKVTIDGKEYFTDVLVSDVFATATVEKLTKDKNDPIDITAGAEYWEQYISKDEINHKHYVNAEEDIITRTCEVDGNYLSDYPAFLSWSGGGNKTNCDCGKCAKDAHTTPDGGWNGDKGTKAYAVNVKGEVISLNVKVFAGSSVIKVYTGGYNLIGELTLKADGVAVAYATFDNKGEHNAQCVSFALEAAKDTEVVVEAVMTNDYDNSPHSCISIAAVTVSGDVYQLERKSARILPDGTVDITLKKNGAALTQGVGYEVVEGSDVAKVTASGVVTGVKNGTATVKVTANGRVRYFTVEVGYAYSLETDKVLLKPRETSRINVISDPVGSPVNATYESSNTSVATVSASGLITAVSNGTATVKVTVDGHEMEITVMVSGLAVTERHEETANTIVDLTSSDVIYWEHYLYNELNPKAVDESKGERDLISGSISDKKGDANSTVKFYYAGSSGPKENSLVDSAWHKYSWGSNYSFDITVPVGAYEIRVYTGVWRTKNKTALYDGEVELASHTFERTNDGINMLVAFAVNTTEEKVLTLKIDSLGGDNNCRLNAIAIVDTTVGNTGLALTGNDTLDGKVVDLTSDSIVDWATFGENDREKEGADMIKTGSLVQGKGAGIATDYRATFDLGGGEKSTSFKHSDEYVSVDVSVDDSVKTMSVYTTGWNADYYLVVTDGNGKVLSTVFVNIVGGSSVAKEITFDVDSAQTDTLTVTVRKLSNSNCGIAAIVLGGEAA